MKKPLTTTSASKPSWMGDYSVGQVSGALPSTGQKSPANSSLAAMFEVGRKGGGGEGSVKKQNKKKSIGAYANQGSPSVQSHQEISQNKHKKSQQIPAGSKGPSHTTTPSSKQHHTPHSKGQKRDGQDTLVSKSTPKEFGKGSFHKHPTPNRETKAAAQTGSNSKHIHFGGDDSKPKKFGKGNFHKHPTPNKETKVDTQTPIQSKHILFGDDESLFPRSQPMSSNRKKGNVQQDQKSKVTPSGGEKKQFQVKRNRKRKAGVFGKEDSEIAEKKSTVSNDTKSKLVDSVSEKKKGIDGKSLTKQPTPVRQNQNNKGEKEKGIDGNSLNKQPTPVRQNQNNKGEKEKGIDGKSLNKQPTPVRQNQNNKGEKEKGIDGKSLNKQPTPVRKGKKKKKTRRNKKTKNLKSGVNTNQKVEEVKTDNVAAVKNESQEGKDGTKKKQKQKRKKEAGGASSQNDSAKENNAVERTETDPKVVSDIRKPQRNQKRKLTDDQGETKGTGGDHDSSPRKRNRRGARANKKKRQASKDAQVVDSPTKDVKVVDSPMEDAKSTKADQIGSEVAKSSTPVNTGKKRRRRSRSKEDIGSDKRTPTSSSKNKPTNKLADSSDDSSDDEVTKKPSFKKAMLMKQNKQQVTRKMNDESSEESSSEDEINTSDERMNNRMQKAKMLSQKAKILTPKEKIVPPKSKILSNKGSEQDSSDASGSDESEDDDASDDDERDDAESDNDESDIHVGGSDEIDDDASDEDESDDESDNDESDIHVGGSDDESEMEEDTDDSNKEDSNQLPIKPSGNNKVSQGTVDKEDSDSDKSSSDDEERYERPVKEASSSEDEDESDEEDESSNDESDNDNVGEKSFDYDDINEILEQAEAEYHDDKSKTHDSEFGKSKMVDGTHVSKFGKSKMVDGLRSSSTRKGDDSDSDLDSKQKEQIPQKFEPNPEELQKTIFVGNLPIEVTTKKLTAFFKTSGQVDTVRFRSGAKADIKMSQKRAMITRELHPGRDSFNAYVVFKTTEGAREALKRNGDEYGNQHIRVDMAQDAKRHNTKQSVFVGNLPFAIETEPLRNHFMQCGDVEGVRLIRDPASGLGKGFGYVLFKDLSSVEMALKLDGSSLSGRNIRVSRALTKSQQSNIIQRKSEKSGGENGKSQPKRRRLDPKMLRKREKRKRFMRKQKAKGKL